jgi:hypothetical protein
MGRATRAPKSRVPGGSIVYDISSVAFRCGGAKNDVWSIARFAPRLLGGQPVIGEHSEMKSRPQQSCPMPDF